MFPERDQAMKFNFFEYDESGEMIQAGFCRDPSSQRAGCALGTLFVLEEPIFDYPQKYRLNLDTMSLELKPNDSE